MGYWKPTTPEQIAKFKAARVLRNKRAKDKIKLRDAGLPKPPPRVSVLAGMTPEQIKARQAEQKRKSRAKIALTKPAPNKVGRPKSATSKAPRVRFKKVQRSRPIKLESPKQVKLRKARKLPMDKPAKPAPKRMANRPEDPNKVKVKLKPGLWVMANPDYDIVELKTKYKIAI